MKGKRKEGKKGEKREINKGKNYDLILKGEKTIYFPSICTVPTWGKNIILEGGGEEYDFFWKIYTPVYTAGKKTKQKSSHQTSQPNPSQNK